MKANRLAVVVALLTLSLVGWLTDQAGRPALVFAFVTAAVFYLSGWGFWRVWRTPRSGRRYSLLGALAGLVIIYPIASIWVLRPALLPQRVWYDFIANRQVTERLVDPKLIKVERWEILGETREVLFAHPAPSGSTALVYPVKIEPGTTFRAYLAVAPEAWSAAGDGVTFSVYVEDNAGMHLRSNYYVDPKHQQQDMRWVPMQVDLSPFRGKLVRVILVTGSGPAGDQSYDWAGWGEPHLERPIWP